MERSSLSKRSRKLFTLSAIYSANSALLRKLRFEDLGEAAKIAQAFWDEVANQFPEWTAVRNREISSGEVRQEYVHSHGIGLHAIGCVGNFLLHQYPKDWKNYISGLGQIDWSRNNTKVWEGRAMVGGKLSKSHHSVLLTTSMIKKVLNLELALDESKAVEALAKAL